LSEAAKGITARDNVKISAGTVAQFKAGKYVDLLPGFEATNGALFKAGIAPCGISDLRMASEEIDMEENYMDIEEAPHEGLQHTGPDMQKEASAVYDMQPSPNPIKNGFLYFNRTASSYKLSSTAGIVILEGENANRLNIDDIAKGLYLLNIDGKAYKILVE
jgi:hypothetical protein